MLALKEKNGFSTVAITDDGTATGKLLGIVTGRDYRVSRMDGTEKVSTFMTPREKMVVAPADTTLKVANDIIWDHKLNSLPIVDENDHLMQCQIEDVIQLGYKLIKKIWIKTPPLVFFCS